MTAAARKFRSFASVHDQIPAFTAVYFVAVLLSAALFTIGAFALLIAGHMSLDLVKYHDLHGYSWRRSLMATIHESVVDIAMLVLALVFAVYLHHSAGVIAVTGVLHAQATILRGLGIMLPKAEILCHAVAIFSNIDDHLRKRRKTGWTSGEYASGWLLVLSIAVLLLAPVILPLNTMEVVHILAEHLVPWGV